MPLPKVISGSHCRLHLLSTISPWCFSLRSSPRRLSKRQPRVVVLHPWRRALLPVVAAVGVAALPALLHTGLVDAFDEPMLAIAWPVTFATDLAVGYFITRLIFRAWHPVIPFFLLIGIASNAFGFLAIAAFHPVRDLHLGIGAPVMALALSISVGLRRARGPKLLWAVHTRRRRRVVVRAIPGRVGSRAGAGADHAFSAARGTRSRIFCGRAA